MRLFFWESKLRKFRPERTKLTKLETNEIFNDCAISREPFDEIDSNFFDFKGIENNTKTDRTKIAEVGAK